MKPKSSASEIRLCRLYDAPVKDVWAAYTEVEQTAKWWGPRGFTLTSHSKDLRPGGVWDYTMHGPDGVDFPNLTTYLEVEKEKRLVYDHGANAKQPPLFRVTVEFSETAGKTSMHMTMGFSSPEVAEKFRHFIKKAGGDATWDRLDEYLTEKLSGRKVFVINRSFSAAVEKMFEHWTSPDLFSKWLAPTGFSMAFSHADIREGGQSQYSMSDGKGLTMYGRANYLEIKKPFLVRYTQQFCNAQGSVARHPFAPTWPETMLTTVRFFSEESGRTRVKVQWEPHGKTTPEEIQTFIQGRAGMTVGWSGSFDKLDELLR